MITIKEDEPLWVERYRPRTVGETILPIEIKNNLQEYVRTGLVPNCIFAGAPGVGKTTAAKALFEELEYDYYFINGSLDMSKDSLRTDIADFASSVSLNGKRKYVLIDEADHLHPHNVQPALRSFIEGFSKNCGFLLTCNQPARIIEALHSRCPTVEFYIPFEERQDLAAEFFDRLQQILQAEKVEADTEMLVEVITKFFPDWRKILNILQNSVKEGKISGKLETILEQEIRKVFGLLKDQNFTKIREWCAHHGTDHPHDVFRAMYDLAREFLTSSGQGQLALSLSKYEYNAAFVTNQEINMVAAMVELMTECEFR